MFLDWPLVSPAVRWLLDRQGAHRFDFVILVNKGRQGTVTQLLQYFYAQLEEFLPKAECAAAGDCSLHISLTGKFYKKIGKSFDGGLHQLPFLSLAPSLLDETRAIVQREMGVDLRTCVSFVWRATWTGRRQPTDVNGTLARIQEDLRHLQAPCVGVSTDFTVFQEPAGGLTCADISNIRQRCVMFVDWHPHFFAALREFNPIIMANLTQPFLDTMAKWSIDPETLSSFFDLAMITQTRHALNFGGHFFLLASELHHAAERLTQMSAVTE